MTTAAQAVREAMEALGGEADLRDIMAWVDRRYPGGWAAIGTTVADLTYPGNVSSGYPVRERFLERVSRGRYRLR